MNLLAGPYKCDLKYRDFSGCAIPYSYLYKRDLSGCKININMKSLMFLNKIR
jgi:hypothetical protein